jgi:outer membrane protein OmpA-like peptidoglycan-associated protein
MKCSTYRSVLPLLCAGLLLTACSLFGHRQPNPEQPHPDAAPRSTLRISQIGFGNEARFSRCTDRECPQVTPKVLASLMTASVAVGTEKAPPPPPEPAASQPTNVGHQKPARATEKLIEPRKVVLHFEANSAQLTVSHKAVLTNALGGIQRSDRIVILGRTDSLGSDSFNQALALARGLAVRDHLLDLVPDLPARISIDAKGRCCYTAPNDSIQGRSLNRRVELIYEPRDEALL